MEDRSLIISEANKCLNCKNPSCRNGCPINTNIPEFINKIKEEKFKEAYIVLQQNNIMSEICSLVCPTEEQCMGSCIKGIKGEPVNINKLEFFVNEWAKKNKIDYCIKPKPSNGKKVAVIGAGPAGIACAVELKKKGYEVTIYEKKEKIGGILEYEIPDFRLEKSKLNSIEKKLSKIGIKIEYKKELGKNLTIRKLQEEYDSIFFGLGAYIPSEYKITDKECESIFAANKIFDKYYNKQNINLGKTVVIGGGNVAMDAARTAKKMGAKNVTVVYRRIKDLMPAIKKEVEAAEKEGIEFVFNTKVLKGILDENNNLKQIECIKTKIVENKVQDILNSNFLIDVNTVIFAIGLKIDEDFFNQMGIAIENGLVKINELGMTNKPGIFAGGDLVLQKPSVCKAIKTGKDAAEGIDGYLGIFFATKNT